MGKRFTLLDGERIVIEDTIHWKNYLMAAALLSICSFSLVFRAYYTNVSLLNRIVGGVVVPPRWQPALSLAEIGVLGFLSLFAVLSMIRTSCIRYYVTDSRVVAVSGLLALNFQEMMLSRIETVLLNQSVYERIYGCGDILCVAPGSQIFLDDVRDARAFKQTILKLISKKEHE